MIVQFVGILFFLELEIEELVSIGFFIERLGRGESRKYQ
jgi:hypothetical protein